jgi:hypothetical protein
MGQQISTSYPLRERENAKGSKRHRQSEAHKAKASRAGPRLPQSDARGKGFKVQSEAYGFRPEGGEASKLYFMRCPDLGVHHWEHVTGPVNIYAAVKMKLARIDHDEAWPVALAKTGVIMEVRYPNSSHILQFACKGTFYPKYECERIK